MRRQEQMTVGKLAVQLRSVWCAAFFLFHQLLRTFPSLQIPSPLPPTSASFLSFEALYTAYVKHLVPSIGIGCQIFHQEGSSGLIKCNRSHPGRYDPPCPWHLDVLRDATSGRWRIDAATSHLQHNHGPAERLLKDPTWIPIVRNADARKALGLPPLSGSNAKKQKPRIKGKEAVRFFFSCTAKLSETDLCSIPRAYRQRCPRRLARRGLALRRAST